MKLQDMAYIYGVTQDDIKATGYQINYMAEVYTNGHRVENTKVNTSTIKSTDLVVTHGQMVVNISGNGKTTKEMVMVN
jgi:hypothetical protein